MREDGCLLCDVAGGRMDVPTIVEGEHVIGFLNEIEAFSRGHSVLFPRRHVASLHEVDDAALAELMTLAKRVAAALGAPAYNVLVNAGAAAGQTVFHAHLHVIPKWTDADGLPVAHGAMPMSQRDLADGLSSRLGAS